jgi:hypothetical protein
MVKTPPGYVLQDSRGLAEQGYAISALSATFFASRELGVPGCLSEWWWHVWQRLSIFSVF